MRVTNVMDAETYQEGDTLYRIVTVAKHKTSDSRDSMKVVLKESHYGNLLMLATYVRAVMSDDEDRVFRTQSGSVLNTTSAVNACLQSAWVKSGAAAKHGRFCATLNRKSVTCISYEANPDMAQRTADQLKHRLSTATKYYRLKESSARAVETVHWLNQQASHSTKDKETLPRTQDKAGEIYEFPGLQTATQEDVRRAIFTMLSCERLTEIIDEASDIDRLEETSFPVIRRAFEEALSQSIDMDISDEILGNLNITMTDDEQLRATILTMLIVEVARHFGCASVPYVRRPDLVQQPEQDQEPQPKKPFKKGPFSKEMLRRVDIVYNAYIEQLLLTGNDPTMGEVRIRMGDNFVDLTVQQLRDKLKNILKAKRREREGC